MWLPAWETIFFILVFISIDNVRKSYKTRTAPCYQVLCRRVSLSESITAENKHWIPRYTPSQADVLVFKAIPSPPDGSANPHAARWYTHIKSYAAEHDSLPGSSTAGETFIGKAAEAAATPAPAAAEEDDEIDLFGEDEEEDAEAEKLKAERVAAYNAKKANKPKAAAKVCRIFFFIFESPVSWLSDILTVGRNHGCQALGWRNGYGSPRKGRPIYWTRWSCLGC